MFLIFVEWIRRSPSCPQKKKNADDKLRAQSKSFTYCIRLLNINRARFAAGWKRGLLFITAFIIALFFTLVNSLSKFFKNFFCEPRFPVPRLLVSMSHFRFCEAPPRQKPLGKIHKKYYDNSWQIFYAILFAKIYDKKSYKMDIYKSPPRVYNDNPE